VAVGIDVGTNSVKGVVLKKKNEKIILDNYFIARTNDSLIKIGQPGVISDFTGKIIKESLDNAGIKSSSMNVAIPSFTSLIITIDVSNIPNKNFEMAVRREVAKYIPVKIDGVVYDWQIINESDFADNENGANERANRFAVDKSDKMVKILVVAIMKEISERYDKVFSAEGLDIDLLEIDSISLTRALTRNKKGVYLILDIGHEVSNILVASQHGVLVNRTIDVGGDRMTKAIADSMNVTLERAEELKRTQGVNVGVEHGSEGFLATVLTVIINEVKKTIELFKSDFNNLEIEEVLLSGGTARMVGLSSLIAQQTGLKVSIGNSLEGIFFVPEIKNSLQVAAPSLNIAIGLALAHFE